MARSRPLSLPSALLLLWAAFIVYGTTIPFDLELDPERIRTAWEGASKVPWIAPDGGRPSLTDAATNLLLFLPWGFLLAILLERRRFGLVSTAVLCAASAGVLSLTVELAQLLSPSRTTSATDLVNNVAGALGGAVAGWLAGGPLLDRGEPIVRSLARTRPLGLVAGTVAAAVLLWSLVPFDLTLDLGELKRSVKTARLLPFGPGFMAELPPIRLADVIPVLFAWIPIGGTIGLGLRESEHRASRRGIGLALVALLALSCEAVQLFVNSRVVDSTDVLAAFAGGALGLLLVPLRGPLPVRALTSGALASIAAALLVSGLAPWRFSLPSLEDLDRVRLIPFLHYFAKTDVGALADALGQVAVYLPAGALLAIRDPGLRPSTAALVAGGLALTVEVGQLFLDERVSDPTDVLLAAFGAVMGVLLWRRALGLRADDRSALAEK